MDAQTVGTWIGGAVLAIVTTVQTIRAGVATKRADDAKSIAQATATKVTEATASANVVAAGDLAKSNADLAWAYKEQAEQWKALAEKTHKEQAEYRQWVHDKNKEDNAIMLTLTAENADLKARTDLTPLLEHMKKHDANAERVADTLARLTDLISALIKNLAPGLTKA